MNFLEICKRVDTMSGIQGMIDNVENPIAAQAVIVNGVVDSFLELQNERRNWEFMLRTARFGAVPGQSTYSINDIFQTTTLTQSLATFDPTASYDKFGRWERLRPHTAYYLEKFDDDGNREWRHRLRYINFVEFSDRYGVAGEGTPSFISHSPENNALVLAPTPKDRYFVLADYYVEPQLLRHNAQIPILPAPFHIMLVYGGLERVGNHYSNPSIYNRYALAHAKLMGDLYREHVPAAYVQIDPVA